MTNNADDSLVYIDPDEWNNEVANLSHTILQTIRGESSRVATAVEALCIVIAYLSEDPPE